MKLIAVGKLGKISYLHFNALPYVSAIIRGFSDISSLKLPKNDKYIAYSPNDSCHTVQQTTVKCFSNCLLLSTQY